MARTNIDLNEDHLAIIMNRHNLKTKKEAVDKALSALAAQPMTIEEALAMRGANAIDDVTSDIVHPWD